MSDAEFSNPAYRIETKRLVVRCYQPVRRADAGRFGERKRRASTTLDALGPCGTGTHRRKDTRLKRFRGMFDLGQDYLYGIFNPEETSLLGGTGLHTRLNESELEIGYWIHKDFINQGLGDGINCRADQGCL